MVINFLFWFAGVLIFGVIFVLLFRPGDVSDVTIAIMLVAAAIGGFVVYQRERGEGDGEGD